MNPATHPCVCNRRQAWSRAPRLGIGERAHRSVICRVLAPPEAPGKRPRSVDAAAPPPPTTPSGDFWSSTTSFASQLLSHFRVPTFPIPSPDVVLREASTKERELQNAKPLVDISAFLSPVGIWELKHIRKLSSLTSLTYYMDLVTPRRLYRMHRVELVTTSRACQIRPYEHSKTAEEVGADGDGMAVSFQEVAQVYERVGGEDVAAAAAAVAAEAAAAAAAPAVAAAGTAGAHPGTTAAATGGGGGSANGAAGGGGSGWSLGPSWPGAIGMAPPSSTQVATPSPSSTSPHPPSHLQRHSESQPYHGPSGIGGGPAWPLPPAAAAAAASGPQPPQPQPPGSAAAVAAAAVAAAAASSSSSQAALVRMLRSPAEAASAVVREKLLEAMRLAEGIKLAEVASAAAKHGASLAWLPIGGSLVGANNRASIAVVPPPPPSSPSQSQSQSQQQSASAGGAAVSGGGGEGPATAAPSWSPQGLAMSSSASSSAAASSSTSLDGGRVKATAAGIAAVATSQLRQQAAASTSSSSSLTFASSSTFACPSEWFVVDDPASHTRTFVIQGSDTLDHWKLNLTFDPVVFEDPALGVKVHRGVYEGALALYDRFLPLVYEHLEASPFSKITFTGHSIGGSLATLLLLIYRTRGVLPPHSIATVYTFGSPAVFCQTHASVHHHCSSHPNGTSGVDAEGATVDVKVCNGNVSPTSLASSTASAGSGSWWDVSASLSASVASLGSASSVNSFEDPGTASLVVPHTTSPSSSPTTSSHSPSCACACGADTLLARLQLPPHVIRNVVMARDAVPRAFACDYRPVADIIKGWGSSFRDHCCLNRHGRKHLYYFVGRMCILQPDSRHTFVSSDADHPMLPPGPELYFLTDLPHPWPPNNNNNSSAASCCSPHATTTTAPTQAATADSAAAAAAGASALVTSPAAAASAADNAAAASLSNATCSNSGGGGGGGYHANGTIDLAASPSPPPPSSSLSVPRPAARNVVEAVWEFMDCPHPLETLADPGAYLASGTISRYHNPDNYTRALGRLKHLKRLEE
ncbi:hypothetical protein Agub_g1422, partial [Astrephomene gubernaculifera]